VILPTRNFVYERFHYEVVWDDYAVYPRGGSMVIRVNDDICYYFQTRKGLRQGYPFSLVLFNIIADMLVILIARAKEGGQVVVSIL
jgi:hypothetical protein